MQESNRHHAMVGGGKRNGGGELQHPLSAHEVGLKAGPERIAAPSDAWNASAGFAEQRIVDGDTERSVGRELLEDGTANDGEDLGDGKAMAGEESIIGRPIVELLTAGGQKAGDGVASQAEQSA